jgi:hypothetical protein
MVLAAIGSASIFRLQVMTYPAGPGSGRTPDEMARGSIGCFADRRLQ